MTIEVTTLSVEVVSKGIKDATDGLNALSVAIAKVDDSNNNVVSSTSKVNEAETKVASSSSNYADKLKIKADLLGKNMEYTAAYMSSIKGLSEADTQLAIASAAQIDAWKALAVAQAEAIKMNEQMNKASIALSETEEQQTNRLRAMAEASIARVAAQQAELAAQVEATAAHKAVAAAATTNATSTVALTSRKKDMLDVEEKEAKAAAAQIAARKELAAGYEALLGKIDPAIKKINQLDELEQQLTKSFKAGVGDLDTYQQMMAKIAEKKLAVSGLEGADTAVKDAKSISAALKDVQLSGAGVRNEMIVLGREIASGNLSRAPGSLSLLLQRMNLLEVIMNPLVAGTLAVGAAIALVTVEAYKGSQELTNFQKALTLTGNYAAISSSQFTDMSHELGKIGTEGTHGAAQALTEVAGTGVFAADKVGLVTKAAIELQEVSGQKISETVKQFEELQKSPVEAAEKLNEKYNFLTQSILLQIEALKQAGDMHGAATVAMNAYADAVDTRSKQIEENAGAIERVWTDVLKVMKAVGSAMGDIGRPQTTQAQILELEAKKKKALADASTTDNIGAGLGFGSGMSSFSKSDQERLDKLKAIKAEEDQAAAMKAQQVESDKKSVQNLESYLKLREAAKGPERESEEIARRKAELDTFSLETLKKLNIERQKDGSYAGKGYELDLETIHRKYKTAQPRTNEYAIDAQIKEQKGIEDAVKRSAAQQQLDNKSAYDTGLEDRKAYIEKSAAIDNDMYNQQIAIQEKIIEISKGKKNLAAAQQAENDLAKLRDEQLTASKKHAADLAKVEADKAASIANYESQLATKLQEDQKTIEDALAGEGMGDAAKAQMNKFRSLQESYNTSQKALNTKLSKGSIGQDEYDTETADLKRNLDERTAAWKQYYTDLDQQRGNWQNGMTSAWENFQYQASDVAGQTKTMFTSAFSGMTDALTKFATTGKLQFGDLTRTIITDIIKMGIQAAESSIFGSLFGGALGIGGAGAAGASAAGTSAIGGSTSAVTMMAAKGAAFNSGGTQYFADGGTFTNGIVNSPTAFAHASGSGVMGEAGPEAIVPLTRTSDGSLGIRQTGSTNTMSSGNVNMSTQINIASDGTATTNTTSDSDKNAAAQQFAATMAAVAKNQIAMEQRQGGLLWKMANGQK